MENSVKAHNCPNCGGTISLKEEKCGWCTSYISEVGIEVNLIPREHLSDKDLALLHPDMPGIAVFDPLKTATIVIT